MHTLPTALFTWALFHISAVNGQTSEAVPFVWNAIPNLVVCEPATVSWLFSPLFGESLITLSVTNFNVAQPAAPASTATGSFSIHDATAVSRGSVSRRDLVDQEITPGFISATTHNFTWSSVNVSAGWYELQASFAEAVDTISSPSFYVALGFDASCLLPPASTTSLPSSAGTPASTPISTTTSGGTATSSGDAASSSGAVLPVSAVSTFKVNRGAIAGGVIGALAIIAAVIAAYFYLRYASASSGAPPKRRGIRRWTGLSSTDSKAQPYPSAVRTAGGANDRHYSQPDSIGPMIYHDSNVYAIGNVGIDSRTSRMTTGLDEDDVAALFDSPSEEKFSSPTHGSQIRSPFSDTGHEDDAVPLDLITSSQANNVTRNSSTSTSSYMNSNNFSRPRSHPGSPYGSPTSTEGPHNATSSSLGHGDSSYPPSPAFPSGTSAVAVPAPAGRRVGRKPVPQYNPNDPALAATAASPLPTVPDSDSSREGSLRGAPREDWPHLAHKGSFGTEGRPVHYLVPDMPPPPRD
ncbi:hypothetical protein GGX14DRAFT_468383 [Mycena pura]|uniref:Transmembrane protein n=1 Tax=Mycena pura TaxID=153505 RepID=A0AAD6Y4R5_9AGAR|nr:hypothetical protein GGX14DRAFT_468383 [Mycena pura]